MRWNLLLLSLLAVACGGSNDPAPNAGDPPADAENNTTTQPTASGDWIVAQVWGSDACGQLPAVGDVARLDDEALRVGTLAVPRMSATTFASCEAAPTEDGRPTTRWMSTEIEARETETGLDLDVTIDRVTDGVLSDCTGYQVTLRPMAACEFEGQFEATSQMIASGSCGLNWAPSTVVIEDLGDGVSVDWEDQYDAELDSDSCTLSATKGISSGTTFDDWSYNGASREVSLEIAIDGNQGSAIAKDMLAEPTIEGEECPGASFAIALERVLGFDEQQPVAAASCGVERPPVCGDGVCGEWEDCSNCEADCGCGEASCARVDGASICIEPCEDVTQPGQCGDGNRCGVLDDRGFVIMPSDPNYCVPTVGRGEGETCEKLTDCEDGLLCHRSIQTIDGRLGVCSEPCGDGVECTAGFVCEQAGDGGRGSFPDAQRACSRVCELGEADTCPADGQVCADFILGGSDICVGRGSAVDAGTECESVNDCAPGLRCLTSGFCTQPCDSAADCPGGAQCTSSGNFGFCQR